MKTPTTLIVRGSGYGTKAEVTYEVYDQAQGKWLPTSRQSIRYYERKGVLVTWNPIRIS